MVGDEVIEVGVLNKEIKKSIEEFRDLYLGLFYKIYIKLCQTFGFINISVEENREFEKIKKYLGLEVSYNQIFSAAIFLSLINIIIFVILSIIFGDILPILIGSAISGLIFFFFIRYPFILGWSVFNRKKAQLILFLLFLAMKTRENPNLELAMLFASKYIGYPLKLDILILLRDVYNKKYSSIKEALLMYSKIWEKDAYYFTIGIEMFISALSESDPAKRSQYIDDSLLLTLDRFLEHLYEIIREIQQPIHLTSMLGITFPTLLLTIFPIAAAMVSNIFNNFTLFMIFNVFIPSLVYFILKFFVEMKYVSTFIKEDSYFRLAIRRNKKINMIYGIIIAVIVFMLLFFLLVFVAFRYLYTYDSLGIFLSFFYILSIGIGLYFGILIYYKNFEKFSKNVKMIDKHISVFLFALSNYLSENIPFESAIFRSYPRFKNTPFEEIIVEFYRKIKSGVPTEVALFDEKNGILIKYPSAYLQSSMELLYESSNVSPSTAAKTAFSLGRYFVYIDKVKERLKDLSSEPIGQLKMLQKVTGPAILGVITAVSIMAMNILNHLVGLMNQFQYSNTPETSGSMDITQAFSLIGGILDIFSPTSSVTPAGIFLVIGIFALQISILITKFLNIVENEDDFLEYYRLLARSVLITTLIYSSIALLGSLALYNFSNSMLSNLSV